MNDQQRSDRLYTAIVLVFLVGLVVLGLLGVPALLVAAIGIVLAALVIAVFHGFFAAKASAALRCQGTHTRVPERYVPTVLEGSSMRRRRVGFLRRHRHASPPLRFH